MRMVMLDMGERKFGDATFFKIGDVSILVDGAHRGDDRSACSGTASIPDQLSAVTGTTAPFAFDLLIVTHCHSDHIGCLPELVRDGKITAKWALVADERLGFGVPLDQPFPAQTTSSDARLVAALREEPLSDSALDREVEELIDAAATLQQRYFEMLATLEARCTKVVRYGRDSVLPLQRAFTSIGLQVLGPTVDQLLVCAERIERERVRGIEATAEHVRADSGDEVAHYRALVSRFLLDNDALEDGGVAAAVNNQSIIVKVGEAPNAVLLTGDMQFAFEDVRWIKQRMAELIRTVRNAGPYAFVRLAHHGASNGTNDALLTALPETRLFGISTGAGDEKHPSPAVLDLLDARTQSIQWARTDRNGSVSLTLAEGTPNWKLDRGKLNDAEPNTSAQVNAKEAKRQKSSISPTSSPTSPVRASTATNRLAAAPRLTFVTNANILRSRVGETADQALEIIRSAGHSLIDLKSNDFTVQDIAQAARGSNGVVLLGGFSVVPPYSVDSLPRGVRRQLPRPDRDLDSYVIWSDDPYGDPDNLGLPSIPVSRIPDAGDGTMLLAALAMPQTNRPERFGLRNRNRPFAEEVFKMLSGSACMLESDPVSPANIDHTMLNATQVYLMLHGDRDDLTRFSGEEAADEDMHGELVVAFSTSNVPSDCGAVVFAGCCYAALTTIESGADWHEGINVTDLPASRSLALSFLKAGVRAFIGSTGTHYSPPHPPYQTAAGPLHFAFWKRIMSGERPAEALMNAKIDYALSMPYSTSAGAIAVEHKTWRQFTCLGLGW
jgi:hypothetical protein